MAIWKIPPQYIIEYSPNGESIKTFSLKTKYLLEELFNSLGELHNTDDSIISSIKANESSLSGKIDSVQTSLSNKIASIENSIASGLGGEVSIISGSIGGADVEILNAVDGQILIYRESDQKFHNEEFPQEEWEPLVICNGVETLTNYDGKARCTLDLQGVIPEQSIEHLIRLVENLYLTLDIAELNPGGYDGLSGETFYGDTNDIDVTAVNVMDVFQGSNTITVDSIEGLIEGSNYLLIDEQTFLWVKIQQIISENSVNRLILQESVTEYFNPDTTKLIRSSGAIDEGSISGDEAFFTTNLISFANEATGEEFFIRRVYFAVKHQNVADAEITADIALRNTATFVKGEVIGVGTGAEQTVYLANRENLTRYKFALYFDGVAQSKGFAFSPATGEVSFIASDGVIVSADYFYDWDEENFVEMKKIGTYPDRHNPNRATTQFTYVGEAGKVAALRLNLNRGAGYAENEIETTGTGKAQGFKLAHQAIESGIQVTPANATWSYNEGLNTIVVNAPEGEAATVSYYWRGKSFSVDSFACMFNE